MHTRAHVCRRGGQRHGPAAPSPWLGRCAALPDGPLHIGCRHAAGVHSTVFSLGGEWGARAAASACGSAAAERGACSCAPLGPSLRRSSLWAAPLLDPQPPLKLPALLTQYLTCKLQAAGGRESAEVLESYPPHVQEAIRKSFLPCPFHTPGGCWAGAACGAQAWHAKAANVPRTQN